MNSPLLDTHCHLNAYFSPSEVAEDARSHDVFVIAVTNLPLEFARERIRYRRFPNVRVALGAHPLKAAEMNAQQWSAFSEHLSATSYIGEVGLDFSRSAGSSRMLQEAVFRRVLEAVSSSEHILTIHSRGAESHVYRELAVAEAGPAIVHWFTGAAAPAGKFLERGDYFSFNPSMLRTQKGKALLGFLPAERILVESDGPYSRASGRDTWPSDVRLVYEELAKRWSCALPEAFERVYANFQTLRKVRRKGSA